MTTLFHAQGNAVVHSASRTVIIRVGSADEAEWISVYWNQYPKWYHRRVLLERQGNDQEAPAQPEAVSSQ